jgi:nicotinate dehydrogenase subunit A
VRLKESVSAVMPALIETRLVINGKPQALSCPSGTTLLAALRNDLCLNGPKYGCGLGECGACTVLRRRRRGARLCDSARRRRRPLVTTLEGLADERGLHPVQQAFIDAQAAQCGYCLNGMLMMTVALLARTPQPTEQQVRQALSANLCRCGTHVEIIAAALRAAELTARAAKGSA